MQKLCKSSHPNIVQIFDLGQLKPDSAFYFLDMELCDFTLEDYCRGFDVPILENWTVIRKQRALALSICLINDQIVDGLIYIHSSQEVHRDLTPHNGIRTSILSLIVSPVLLANTMLEDR